MVEIAVLNNVKRLFLEMVGENEIKVSAEFFQDIIISATFKMDFWRKVLEDCEKALQDNSCKGYVVIVRRDERDEKDVKDILGGVILSPNNPLYNRKHSIGLYLGRGLKRDGKVCYCLIVVAWSLFKEGIEKIMQEAVVPSVIFETQQLEVACQAEGESAQSPNKTNKKR